MPKSVCLLALLSCLLSARAGYSQPNAYQRVDGWPIVPDNFKWGVTAAVAPDAQGNLWVAQRGDPPILKFDRSGKLVGGFGSGMFSTPHGIVFDHDGNLWVTDSGPFSEQGRVPGKGHQVFKMSPEGKVLMTLGQPNVSKAGPDTFIAPTGVVIGANGDIFVADGHTPRGGQQDGDRVVKFSKDGKFIKSWGVKGAGPGELNGPHGIAMDSQGRIFIADRMNNRIEIFDQDGRYLDHWMHFSRPSGIWIDSHDTLYVADNGDPDKNHPGWHTGIRIGNAKDGSLIGFIDGIEPEVVGTDAEGNVYAGLTPLRRLDKYSRKK